MGRLRKSVVDTIVRLRKQGYTQAETAEKVGVHLKSVQKYDPLRKTKKMLSTAPTTSDTVKKLEKRVSFLGDWVESIRVTLKERMQLGLICPSCLEGELIGDESGHYVCNKCEYKMPEAGYI